MYFAYLQQVYDGPDIGQQLRGITEYCAKRDIELSNHVVINPKTQLDSHRQLWELYRTINWAAGERIIVYSLDLIPLKKQGRRWYLDYSKFITVSDDRYRRAGRFGFSGKAPSPRI